MQTNEPKTQFRLRTLFVVTTVVAFLLGGCILYIRAQNEFFHAILVGKTGPVESREDWPDPLKKLIDERQQDIAIDTIKVYQLCQGFDPEFVFRIDAPIDLRDYVVEKWELTQVPSPRLISVFNGRSQISGVATPEWWKPSSVPDIKYYVCPRTLAGEKSDRFQVAYSESTRVLYVHYWFNF